MYQQAAPVVDRHLLRISYTSLYGWRNTSLLHDILMVSALSHVLWRYSVSGQDTIHSHRVISPYVESGYAEFISPDPRCYIIGAKIETNHQNINDKKSGILSISSQVLFSVGMIK
jgi:hypothetical protein